MPRPKKPQPPVVSAPLLPSKTSHLFQPARSAERAGTLTRERIAEHLTAFQNAGGKIQVLPTNGSMARDDQPIDAASAAPAHPPARRAR